MEGFRILEVKQSIFESNDREADKLREDLKKERTFLLNLMSSPGSGKTTTLRRTIEALKDEFRIGVMEADIDSDVDAATIEKTGAKVIQIHTGGMCHLDAGMTRQGLEGLGTEDVDLAILENIGNLVCPAEFDTGAVKNAMILSVPEGDDKPLKYPLMFSICDVLLINKIDCPSPPAPARASTPGPTGCGSRRRPSSGNKEGALRQSFAGLNEYETGVTEVVTPVLPLGFCGAKSDAR